MKSDDLENEGFGMLGTYEFQQWEAHSKNDSVSAATRRKLQNQKKLKETTTTYTEAATTEFFGPPYTWYSCEQEMERKKRGVEMVHTLEMCWVLTQTICAIGKEERKKTVVEDRESIISREGELEKRAKRGH